ncbi:MAG: UPF0147 family protein [Candidatus Woesearchaeota archaeon]
MNLQLANAVEIMKELSEDNTLPKNVKQKLLFIVEILENNGDLSLKVSKAIHELEEIVEDKNLQAYSRTQLFNVISTLESI